MIAAIFLLQCAFIRASAFSLTATVDAPGWATGLPWANVTVSWDAAPAGGSQGSDWIGAFLLGYNSTYIHFVNVVDAKEEAIRDGEGESHYAVFRLLSARTPYIFHYFRGNEILTTSNRVEPRGDVPNQGHLSFVPGSPGSMVISWTSNQSKPGTVRYGLSPSSLNASAISVVDTYTAADFTSCMGIPSVPPRTTPFENLATRSIRCGFYCYDDPTSSELFLDPGYLHSATMKDLEAGELYYYDFGTASGALESSSMSGKVATQPQRSPVYSFVAPRVAGSRGEPSDSSFSFLVTADLGIGGPKKGEEGSAVDNDPNHVHPGYPNGIGNGADNVISGILADPGLASDEFILVNGDISYARGWPWIWERFFDLVQPLTTKMPMMVGVGNHEVDSHENPFEETSGGDSGGECGVVAAKRFPAHLESPQKMWYSFTHGSVHIIQLSTEHPVGEQIKFFKEDIASLDRDKVPWLIVSMHRPIFISEVVASAKLQNILVQSWHPLFVESGVDFVYTGHAHYYERLCAVEMTDPKNSSDLKCSTTRDRPIYIVDGSAGATPDMSSPTSPLTKYKEFAKWGYSRISVTPSSLELIHFAAEIAPDGLTVQLPYKQSDSIKLLRTSNAAL